MQSNTVIEKSFVFDFFSLHCQSGILFSSFSSYLKRSMNIYNELLNKLFLFSLSLFSSIYVSVCIWLEIRLGDRQHRKKKRSCGLERMF